MWALIGFFQVFGLTNLGQKQGCILYLKISYIIIQIRLNQQIGRYNKIDIIRIIELIIIG